MWRVEKAKLKQSKLKSIDLNFDKNLEDVVYNLALLLLLLLFGVLKYLLSSKKKKLQQPVDNNSQIIRRARENLFEFQEAQDRDQQLP